MWVVYDFFELSGLTLETNPEFDEAVSFQDESPTFNKVQMALPRHHWLG